MYERMVNSAKWLQWSDLWPPGTRTRTSGWAEQLEPGVHLLLDETGEEGRKWAAVLAGSTEPQRGRVQCNGLCSQADLVAYQRQVYWQKPRNDMQLQEMTALRWVHNVARQWPQWSDGQWQRHCDGLGLAVHMNKPLWHLSTGCLRKLGIAAALASQAPLTLIEEPVAALDAQSVRYLCTALETMRTEIAAPHAAARWIVVVHWELLPHVMWDQVVIAPSLVRAEIASMQRENAHNNGLPMQQSLL